MEMLTKEYLGEYKNKIVFDIDDCLENLHEPENGGFRFLIEASAVYSSNIEGNTMDLNSFMNSKTLSGPKPKESREIDDLVEAYDFARTHELTEENFLEAHGILSKLIVSEGNQGKYRQDKVGVFSSRGLAYMAVEHENVRGEMQKLFSAIVELKSQKSNEIEALYFASLAHLQLAQIHPFIDGNGRAARLLEKWFLAELIGERAWYIESEKYYKESLQEYYKNIALGPNYYELDYSGCVPFLLMLTSSLKESCESN